MTILHCFNITMGDISNIYYYEPLKQSIINCIYLTITECSERASIKIGNITERHRLLFGGVGRNVQELKGTV